MRRLAFLVLLSLGACAGAGGGAWPSLAMRAGENAPLVPRPLATGPASPAAVSGPAAATASPVRANDDSGAQLAAIERDIKAFAARLDTQLAATARAATAAAGTAAASTEGAAGQLELSRLDRLGGQGADLRDRLNALAGELARRGGAAPTMGAVGVAIERLEGLRAAQAKGFAEARAKLPR